MVPSHRLGSLLIAGVVYLTTAWAGDQFLGSLVRVDQEECQAQVEMAREFNPGLTITDCQKVVIGQEADEYSAPQNADGGAVAAP